MNAPDPDGAAAESSHADAVRRFYRVHARMYDPTRRAFLFGRKAAVDALGLRPGDRMLEVGCGTGLNFPLLVSAVGLGGRVLGVDCSDDMLARARRRIRRCAWSNVVIQSADAADLALETHFDAALFSYSISMIPRWEQALVRAANHLKPSGKMCVLDFGSFSPWPWPVRPVIGAWLRVNHVQIDRPIEARMRDLLDDVTIRRRFGDYYFIAAGERRR